MITIGDAFHWMKREQVLRLAHAWLRQGGGLAILANRSKGLDEVQVIIDRVQAQFLGTGHL